MRSFVGLAGRAARAAFVSAVVFPGVGAAQTTADDAARAQARSSRALASSVTKPASAENAFGAPATIAIEGGARRMLVGATVPHVARVRDAAGAEQREASVRWTTSDPNIASVNQFGVMTAVRPGTVTVRAASGGLAAERRYVVEANPVRSLTLSITADQPRTGEVVEVAAMAFDANGVKVPNVPYLYTFTAAVEDSAVGQLAPAELDQKGRFVAQKAGDYQIIAVAPGLVAHRTVRVSNRNVGESARLVGRAAMAGSTPLADVAAWRGRDGRDYAIACAGGARSHLVSFEISDAGLRAVDTAVVEGRSIADCVVDSESGLAIVARETATGRGSLAVFDVTDPRAIKPLGTFDDGLGSIAGVAIHKRHALVVSDARRLEVVSFEDPAKPRRTGSLDLAGDRGQANGGSDVSVTDGVAYVALGRAGVALVDIGGGKAGGTLAKPARMSGFHAPFASTHAAYGYRSRTGKWYVITSEDLTGADHQASSNQPGFARIIDFTEPNKPEEIARYEVPETGVQDLWVDGERLYVAAQAGGVRVVDISADLKGNLYHQGREIARFVAADTSATPNVVAVQPVRGGVLAADRASGIWFVRLSPKGGQ